jgi:hypothetical protein
VRQSWEAQLQLPTALGTDQPSALQSNQYNPGVITREKRQLIFNWQRQACGALSLQLLPLPIKEMPLSTRTAPPPRIDAIRFLIRSIRSIRIQNC